MVSPKKIITGISFTILIIFALIGMITVGTYVAVNLHLTNVAGVIDSTNRYLNVPQKTAWMNSDEWQTLEKAIPGDKQAIDTAAEIAGVPSRLIVAQLVVEQLRLYGSDRELFKKIFAPSIILGVQSQFSWGVMGLKEETAQKIEQNLTTATSTFYLGRQYEHLLDFTTPDHNSERYSRLTDQHDHSYSYLYTGLFLKQIITQWKNAGYDISNRPEILSTLFNIGFAHSNPNTDPKVGGAEITVNGEAYSFGELAYAFYISDKLVTEFPR